jgi:hypothetical protein
VRATWFAFFSSAHRILPAMTKRQAFFACETAKSLIRIENIYPACSNAF